MNAVTPMIEVENLQTYYGASHVLHGVSFHVNPGETVCLMGRNGMGKTTTLRSIIGLTPPRHGTVKVEGTNVTGWPAHRVVKKGIAFVPENRGIFPNLSVRENLIMASRPNRQGRVDWSFERVVETFPRLGERLDNMGNQLSGGEQQMLTIGRALMTNPDLLILDEATEGLAPLIRKEIWSVIKTIKATGIASIVVDKDVKSLLEISDRGLIMVKGRIVHDGPAAELAANPELHVRYLGV
ncbi:MAG: ABC transporter ATP-binding protein [Alphaproteobacteria bacterium]|nr:ABC transporter ATP-binding protein [Alphaproteobacteria bacterium]CAA6603452.1 ATP binding protein [Rhodospirillaceae bacterium LM-1]